MGEGGGGGYSSPFKGRDIIVQGLIRLVREGKWDSQGILAFLSPFHVGTGVESRIYAP